MSPEKMVENLNEHILKVCKEYSMAIEKIFEIPQPYNYCAFAMLSYSFAETFTRLYWYGSDANLHFRAKKYEEFAKKGKAPKEKNLTRPSGESSELWFEEVLKKTDAYKKSQLLQSIDKTNFKNFRNSVIHGWGYDSYCCMPSTNHIPYTIKKCDLLNNTSEDYEKTYVIHMIEFRDMIIQGSIITLDAIGLIEGKTIRVEKLDAIWKNFSEDISFVAVKKRTIFDTF